MKKQTRQCTEFENACYHIISKVPPGRVTTYGEIAKALAKRGYSKNASRAVGGAMGRNPFAPKVPCHRVVCSNGKLGGYNGGLKRKISLLGKEGVLVSNGVVENFGSVLWKFK